MWAPKTRSLIPMFSTSRAFPSLPVTRRGVPSRGLVNPTNVKAMMPNPLIGKSVISSHDFTRHDVEATLDWADYFMKGAKGGARALLADKRIAMVFYENSTRTMSSFVAAALNLGSQVMEVWAATSSVQKGETLEDTIKTMQNYCDAIVLRHPEVGAAKRAAAVARVPVFNAGDGAGEHPTQALLDACLMRAEHGSLDGVSVTLVGDLKHGRTVHSLSVILSRFNDVTLNLVSPPSLRLTEEFTSMLQGQAARGLTINHGNAIEDFLGQTDFLYMTRVQKERFANVEDYDAVKDDFILTPETMAHAHSRTLIMHPFPRVNEITPDLDSDPRCRYFDQPRYGVYTRQALLAMSLGAV